MYIYGRFQIEYNPFTQCHQYILSLVQIIIFHQTTSICDQNPGQPCSIKAGTLHHLKLMNRLRCFGASLIYYKLLALGSSMFSQILCQQIANELEKKLLWTGNSLKCSNFVSRNYFLEDLWLGIQKELFLFDCTFRKLGSWMNINWLFVNSVYMVCIFFAMLASFIPAFSFYILSILYKKCQYLQCPNTIDPPKW